MSDMKKMYEQPVFYVDLFELEDVLTNSGIGAGDGVIDTLDDDPTNDVEV